MGGQKATKTCSSNRIGSYLMSFDSFGETFKMKLDSGQAALPTIMGTALSFIYFCLVIGYTAMKFDVLANLKDVDITYAIEDNHFSEDDTFSGRQGFNIAVALTQFDTVPVRENELLPEYAYINFEIS